MAEVQALKWHLPHPGQCGKCKAVNRWELSMVGRNVTATLVHMHACQCPESSYRKEAAACKAKGGHFWEEQSAGQHSYDKCRECGHIR